MGHHNSRVAGTGFLRGIALWILLWAAPAGAEKFTIAVIPDTQFYSALFPTTFQAQTNWIVNNQTDGGMPGDPHPIIYVAHLGDLVDNFCVAADTQWTNAVTAMDTLRTAGIPHGVLPGNHDFDNLGPGMGDPPFCLVTGATTKYNGNPSPPRFGPAQYPNYPPWPPGYYGGGTPAGSNENNYTLFESAGGVGFIAINLMYSQDAVPAISAWADARLKQFPDRIGIVTSHFIQPGGTTGNCNIGGTFSNFGQDLWNELSDNPNLFMMLSGHCDGERWLRILSNEMGRSSCMGRVDGLMSNYQAYGFQNSGNMRLMRFDTVANTLTIDTFSVIGATVGTPNSSTNPAAMNTTTASDVTITNYNLSPILRPSVVLLQDVSGSMGWAIDGTPGVPTNQQRLSFAQEAAKEFLDLLQVAPASPGTANVGVASFGGVSGNQVQDLTVSTAANITTTKTAIDGLNASGGTPLVSGVETADNILDEQNCRAVVLLSDGYHNVPSRATVGDAPIENLLTGLDSDTRIFSVAFGNTVEVDIPLLQELANRTQPAGLAPDSQFFDATASAVTAGTSAAWSPPTGLSNAYTKIIGDVLDLQSAVDPFGRIGPGETQSFPVQVTEHDSKVTFHLSWATPERRLLSFRVFDSSGNEIPPPGSEFPPGVQIINGTSYRIMSVNRDALAMPGRIGPEPWRFEVIHNREARDPGSTPQPGESYQYNVLVDSGLKLHAALDRADAAVGDSITLTAELREGRRPITGLSEVTVTVSAPTDGRGNWLSLNDVSPEQLARIPPQKGTEALTPVVRKGLYLTDIARLQFPVQRGPQVLRLFDDGTNGDVTADDGIYTNRFNNTDREGTYSFYFSAQGPTRNGNRFLRERQIQTHLAVRVVPQAIAIDVASLEAGDLNRFSVQATPRDSLGNYLGPGYAGRISFTAAGGSFAGAVQDNLDGSYSQTLNLPPGTTPSDVQVSVTVDEASRDFNLGAELRQYAFSIHLGQTRPGGSFGNRYDPDYHLGLDVERPLDTRLSVIGELQYNRFEAAQSGLSDTYWISLSGGLKYTLSPGAWQPFVAGSIGVYDPRSGSTEPGLHLGLGVKRDINPRWSLEIGAGYHHVFTSGSDVEFSVIRAGLIFRP